MFLLLKLTQLMQERLEWCGLLQTQCVFVQSTLHSRPEERFLRFQLWRLVTPTDTKSLQ